MTTDFSHWSLRLFLTGRSSQTLLSLTLSMYMAHCRSQRGGPFCLDLEQNAVCHCWSMPCAPALVLGAGTAVPELRLQSGAAATLATPPAVSRPGKLTPPAEARLLLAFGLQDTLTREEALVLAEQASTPSLCKGIAASLFP